MSVVMTSARLGRHCRSRRYAVLSSCSGIALDSFIESIWAYQNDPRPHALERVMPTDARTADRQPQGRPDTPLRAGVPVSMCFYIGLAVIGRAHPFKSSTRQNRSTWRASRSSQVAWCRSSACLHTKRVTPTFPSSCSGAFVILLPLLRERLLESRTIEAALDAFEAVLQDGATEPHLPLPMPSPRSIKRHRRPALHE